MKETLCEKCGQHISARGMSSHTDSRPCRTLATCKRLIAAGYNVCSYSEHTAVERRPILKAFFQPTSETTSYYPGSIGRRAKSGTQSWMRHYELFRALRSQYSSYDAMEEHLRNALISNLEDLENLQKLGKV